MKRINMFKPIKSSICPFELHWMSMRGGGGGGGGGGEGGGGGGGYGAPFYYLLLIHTYS